jgi:hypothetical protein
MEVRSVWVTGDRLEADSACEELRAHGIKCDTIQPTVPHVSGPFTSRGAHINVVVAPWDEDRANEVLDAWADTL